MENLESKEIKENSEDKKPANLEKQKETLELVLKQYFTNLKKEHSSSIISEEKYTALIYVILHCKEFFNCPELLKVAENCFKAVAAPYLLQRFPKINRFQAEALIQNHLEGIVAMITTEENSQMSLEDVLKNILSPIQALTTNWETLSYYNHDLLSLFREPLTKIITSALESDPTCIKSLPKECFSLIYNFCQDINNYINNSCNNHYSIMKNVVNSANSRLLKSAFEFCKKNQDNFDLGNKYLSPNNSYYRDFLEKVTPKLLKMSLSYEEIDMVKKNLGAYILTNDIDEQKKPPNHGKKKKKKKKKTNTVEEEFLRAINKYFDEAENTKEATNTLYCLHKLLLSLSCHEGDSFEITANNLQDKISEIASENHDFITIRDIGRINQVPIEKLVGHLDKVSKDFPVKIDTTLSDPTSYYLYKVVRIHYLQKNYSDQPLRLFPWKNTLTNTFMTTSMENINLSNLPIGLRLNTIKTIANFIYTLKIFYNRELKKAEFDINWLKNHPNKDIQNLGNLEGLKNWLADKYNSPRYASNSKTKQDFIDAINNLSTLVNNCIIKIYSQDKKSLTSKSIDISFLENIQNKLKLICDEVKVHDEYKGGDADPSKTTKRQQIKGHFPKIDRDPKDIQEEQEQEEKKEALLEKNRKKKPDNLFSQFTQEYPSIGRKKALENLKNAPNLDNLLKQTLLVEAHLWLANKYSEQKRLLLALEDINLANTYISTIKEKTEESKEKQDAIELLRGQVERGKKNVDSGLEQLEKSLKEISYPKKNTSSKDSKKVSYPKSMETFCKEVNSQKYVLAKHLKDNQDKDTKHTLSECSIQKTKEGTVFLNDDICITQVNPLEKTPEEQNEKYLPYSIWIKSLSPEDNNYLLIAITESHDLVLTYKKSPFGKINGFEASKTFLPLQKTIPEEYLGLISSLSIYIQRQLEDKSLQALFDMNITAGSKTTTGTEKKITHEEINNEETKHEETKHEETKHEETKKKETKKKRKRKKKNEEINHEEAENEEINHEKTENEEINHEKTKKKEAENEEINHEEAENEEINHEKTENEEINHEKTKKNLYTEYSLLNPAPSLNLPSIFPPAQDPNNQNKLGFDYYWSSNHNYSIRGGSNDSWRSPSSPPVQNPNDSTGGGSNDSRYTTLNLSSVFASASNPNPNDSIRGGSNDSRYTPLNLSRVFASASNPNPNDSIRGGSNGSWRSPFSPRAQNPNAPIRATYEGKSKSNRFELKVSSPSDKEIKEAGESKESEKVYAAKLSNSKDGTEKNIMIPIDIKWRPNKKANYNHYLLVSTENPKKGEVFVTEGIYYEKDDIYHKTDGLNVKEDGLNVKIEELPQGKGVYSYKISIINRDSSLIKNITIAANVERSIAHLIKNIRKKNRTEPQKSNPEKPDSNKYTPKKLLLRTKSGEDQVVELTKKNPSSKLVLTKPTLEKGTNSKGSELPLTNPSNKTTIKGEEDEKKMNGKTEKNSTKKRKRKRKNKGTPPSSLANPSNKTTIKGEEDEKKMNGEEEKKSTKKRKRKNKGTPPSSLANPHNKTTTKGEEDEKKMNGEEEKKSTKKKKKKKKKSKKFYYLSPNCYVGLHIYEEEKRVVYANQVTKVNSLGVVTGMRDHRYLFTPKYYLIPNMTWVKSEQNSDFSKPGDWIEQNKVIVPFNTPEEQKQKEVKGRKFIWVSNYHYASVEIKPSEKKVILSKYAYRVDKDNVVKEIKDLDLRNYNIRYKVKNHSSPLFELQQSEEKYPGYLIDSVVREHQILNPQDVKLKGFEKFVARKRRHPSNRIESPNSEQAMLGSSKGYNAPPN